MVNPRSFGRRVNVQPRQPRAAQPAERAVPSVDPALAEIPAAHYSPPPARSDSPSLDDELRDWKQAHRQEFNFPWRLLSLMATLCFGLASFVLPDSVNDNVQWLLYALAAASFLAGFAKRRHKAER